MSDAAIGSRERAVETLRLVHQTIGQATTMRDEVAPAALAMAEQMSTLALAHIAVAIEARLGEIAAALNKAPAAIAINEPANITFVGDPDVAVERAREVREMFDKASGGVHR